MSRFLRVNEHPIERGARMVLGLALIGSALTGLVGPWAYLGVIPLLTGAIGSCPLYTLLGISTCPISQRKA